MKNQEENKPIKPKILLRKIKKTTNRKLDGAFKFHKDKISRDLDEVENGLLEDLVIDLSVSIIGMIGIGISLYADMPEDSIINNLLYIGTLTFMSHLLYKMGTYNYRRKKVYQKYTQESLSSKFI